MNTGAFVEIDYVAKVKDGRYFDVTDEARAKELQGVGIARQRLAIAKGLKDSVESCAAAGISPETLPACQSSAMASSTRRLVYIGR